ncbi:MAG: ATP-binding protein [Synechocystis sp.]|jgi:chemotaxis family two-component system sensor kinase Cph1
MATAIKLTDQSLRQLETLAIHNSQMIQPHGLVMVLQEPDLTIAQISTNCQGILGRSPESLIGQGLGIIFDSFQLEPILAKIAAGELEVLNPSKLWARVDGDNYVVFDGVFHRNADGLLVCELEPAYSADTMPFLGFYHLANQALMRLRAQANLSDFYDVIVQEVRHMTGFDRVMLYRFDEQNHGDVIAEEKRDDMEPYLGLHYPESDIPQPARRLFIHNPIRVIPNVAASAMPLYPLVNPITNKAVDLTESILRSAYSCHLDYLRNMGVGASLTISLIKDGKLWGLIACHHLTPKVIPFELRKACEFFGRVVFNNISAQENTENFDYRVKLAEHEAVLLDSMTTANDFIEGLEANAERLMGLTGSQGAAICFGDRLILLGQTPSEQAVQYLLQWLETQDLKETFFTPCLSQLYADAVNFKEVASGILAIPIARHNFLLWFRPEVLQTVNWGGDPNNAYEAIQQEDGKILLHPRQSFDLWKEIVKLHSLPWQPIEVQSALALKKAIVNLILRQAEELAELARNLERSNADLKKFAYIASHDLQEPLNQVSNYVQLLEMRYSEALDEDAKDFIDFAVSGVTLMQTLIDDILTYSKVDTQYAQLTFTDVQSVVSKALANLKQRINQCDAQIEVGSMPAVMADQIQLMQVFQNLIGNAIKFRRDTPPVIKIWGDRREEDWVFAVQDNGIGIDPQFFERIFVIFQRLHTRDEYGGTGMGLAICKKIIEGHRGKIWVESNPGAGSTFYFSIPING